MQSVDDNRKWQKCVTNSTILRKHRHDFYKRHMTPSPAASSFVLGVARSKQPKHCSPLSHSSLAAAVAAVATPPRDGGRFSISLSSPQVHCVISSILNYGHLPAARILICGSFFGMVKPQLTDCLGWTRLLRVRNCLVENNR